MWRIESTALDDRTQRWNGVVGPSGALAFHQVCAAWRSDAAFREFWIGALAALRMDAYCWECPPVSIGNRSRPFECVFVPSPSLARMAPEPEAFAEHFPPHCQSATFANLGGDAVLIAPCPGMAAHSYGHLAQFVRDAPAVQQQALWKAVGEALESRLRAEPTWLSTAGHGVAWLHVRLDSRPKYYRHAPYMKA